MTVTRTEPAQAFEPLLNIEDLADLIGMSLDAIYMTRHRGDMPGVLGFKVGRRLKFDPVEVRAFVAAQKAATQPGRVVVNFEDRRDS